MTTQIIAMAGGGFMVEPDNPVLDEYVLAQATSPRPRILFLPTAQGDSHDAIARFYSAFERFACVPTIQSSPSESFALCSPLKLPLLSNEN